MFIFIIIVTFIIFMVIMASPQAQIKRRVRQAGRRKINEKAAIVIQQLGKDNLVYLDDFLKIETPRKIENISSKKISKSIHRLSSIKIIQLSDKQVVFESEYISWPSREKEAHLELIEYRQYDTYDGDGSNWSSLAIRGYITGDWENHFEKLYMQAVAKEKMEEDQKNQLAKDEERKRKDEERKKFGL